MRFHDEGGARYPFAKSEPGKGDDIPCEVCHSIALDTGLECSECGHDNYAAVTGNAWATVDRYTQEELDAAIDAAKGE